MTELKQSGTRSRYLNKFNTSRSHFGWKSMHACHPMSLSRKEYVWVNILTFLRPKPSIHTNISATLSKMLCLRMRPKQRKRFDQWSTNSTRGKSIFPFPLDKRWMVGFCSWHIANLHFYSLERNLTAFSSSEVTYL